MPKPAPFRPPPRMGLPRIGTPVGLRTTSWLPAVVPGGAQLLLAHTLPCASNATPPGASKPPAVYLSCRTQAMGLAVSAGAYVSLALETAYTFPMLLLGWWAMFSTASSVFVGLR